MLFLGAKRMQDEVYVLDESSMAAEDLLFMIKTEQHETWLLPFFHTFDENCTIENRCQNLEQKNTWW